MQTKSVHILGGVLFFFGVFLGLVLAFIAIWSEYEGFSYFNTGAGYPSFNGLACPILMTRSDKSVVTANFRNSGSQEIEPYYEVAISGPVASRNYEGQLSVPAHTMKSIRWTVSADDVDLGLFIFVDLNVLPVAGYSTREDMCGIMVLNLTGPSGGQVFTLILAASLVGIVLGLGLWKKNVNINIPNYSNQYRAFRSLGILVLLALLTSIMSWWALGLIFCVLTILLLVINLRLALG